MKKRVLIGCECSATVRNAFIAQGCDAYSCDLKPSEEGPIDPRHFHCSILDVMYDAWDLFICHPPCTFLTRTQNRWMNDHRYPNRKRDQEDSIKFVELLWNAPIKQKCFENPIGVLGTRWRPYSQIIDPTQFGHAQCKGTCLWLDNLPLLTPPSFYEIQNEDINLAKLSFAWHERDQTKRSRTFPNIAYAMATQWSKL